MVIWKVLRPVHRNSVKLSRNLMDGGCLLRNLTIHSKKYGFGRQNHSVRREKNPQSENDSGLIDPTNSMWRSVTADHKEIEQAPTDQTENILNYYKERWIQEHKERNNVEVISGSEVSRNPDSGNKKSLYSQLARKTPLGNSSSGNLSLGYQHGETVVRSRDPFQLQKMSPIETKATRKENSLDQIRRTESAPGFWTSDKNPHPPMAATRQANSHLENTNSREPKNYEMNNSFKQSFSKVDFDEGAPSFGNKMDRMESSRGLAQSNKYMRQESKKDNQETEGKGSSFPFQPTSPPIPDFKSS